MSKPKRNQSKNIVISTQCFLPVLGGMENLMGNLAKNLHKKKYNIFVFADGKNSAHEKQYDKKLNYEIIRYSGIKILRKRRKIRDIKKFINFKKNINSIFCDSWKSAENLVNNKVLNNQRIFCLAHGNDVLAGKNLLKKKRIKKTLNNCDQVISNSKFTKNKIIDLGIKSKKIKVIYPGIDTCNVNSKKNTSVFKKYKKFRPILLTIARLEKRKNHKRIIYAVNDLVKEFTNMLYLIAGEGPEIKKITKLINSLSLNNNVKILEFLDIFLYIYLLTNNFFIEFLIEDVLFGSQIIPVLPLITDSLVPPTPLDIEGIPLMPASIYEIPKPSIDKYFLS